MTSQRGYVMLMSVLIVGALGLAIGLGLLSIGSAAAQTEIVLEQAAKARALADGCVELALARSTQCTPLTQTWQTADGTCEATMTVVNGDRAIRAQANVGGSKRRAAVTVRFAEKTAPNVLWQETPD